MRISRVFLATLFSFSLFGCALTSGQDTKKANYYLQIGTSYLVNSDFPTALRSLLQAERLNPKSPVIQNNMGLTYYGMKKYSLAIQHLKNALDLQSNYTDARNNLGGVYVTIGKYDDAITQLKIAQKDLTYEHQDRVNSNLGLAYFYKKDYVRAKVALSKALTDQGQTDCRALQFYARSLYELQQYQPAGESFDRVAQECKDQQSEEARFYGGMAFMKLKQNEKAQGRFREVIELFPKGAYAKKAHEILEILK